MACSHDVRKREQALIIESKGTREVAMRAFAGERSSSVLRCSRQPAAPVAEKQRGGGLPGSPEAGERSLIVAAHRQHSRQPGIEMPVGDAGARGRPEGHSKGAAGY
jgi:hypothetical protein